MAGIKLPPKFFLNSHHYVIQSLLRTQTQDYFKFLQDRICKNLETVDGTSRFSEDSWSHQNGGGGRSRVLQNGGVFEKAGVNYSAVDSILSGRMAERMNVQPQSIFATGISLVLHPFSPMIPTVHMNLRYLELANGDAWFGGGMDLTPYYLFDDDAKHFHRTVKTVCDKYDPDRYLRFKQWCDEYFTVKHRNETRGIGGIFFDYQRDDLKRFFSFLQDAGDNFLDTYLPIVKRRKTEPWGEREKQWQLVRRGRYVEFNLLYDRGTLFGLETGGRTESILMSLPPAANWIYDHRVEPASREERLINILQHPQSWI